MPRSSLTESSLIEPRRPASSPCIRLCVLDPATGLCEGCGRTGEEIAAWGGLSEPERLAVMAELPGRLAALAPEPAPAAAVA